MQGRFKIAKWFQTFRKKMMKRLLLLLTLPLLGLTNAARAEDDLPAPAKFARYEAMLKRSPFCRRHRHRPGRSHTGFRERPLRGQCRAFGRRRFRDALFDDGQEPEEYLNTKETVGGYTISNIQWSDRVGETKVTISKDGQFATLTFNEALLSQAIQNPVNPMVQQPQGIPGRPCRAGQMSTRNANSAAHARAQIPTRRRTRDPSSGEKCLRSNRPTSSG